MQRLRFARMIFLGELSPPSQVSRDWPPVEGDAGNTFLVRT